MEFAHKNSKSNILFSGGSRDPESNLSGKGRISTADLVNGTDLLGDANFYSLFHISLQHSF